MSIELNKSTFLQLMKGSPWTPSENLSENNQYESKMNCPIASPKILISATSSHPKIFAHLEMQ